MSPDERAPRPRGSCARIVFRLLMVALAVALVLAVTAGFGAYMVYDYVTGTGTEGVPVRVEIPNGVTGDQAAQVLADAGLVDHEIFFRLALRLDDTKKPIKTGYYDIPQGLSPAEILDMLQEGPNVADARFKITIAEGQTIMQVAEQFPDPSEFIRAASDPGLIRSLGLNTPTLEGFLMPDTYFFSDEPSAEEVVRRMAEEFQKRYRSLLEDSGRVPNRSMLEVVTIASLVEEESRVDEERALVAAVIYNRLKRNMTLDFDSTLQYALNKYGRRLLDSDKQVDSPYNTYRNPGLPPGPISNPGIASLRAALEPASVDYLYFVSNADGKTHTFSTTLEEHNRAVAKFRREIAIQRKEQAADAE